MTAHALQTVRARARLRWEPWRRSPRVWFGLLAAALVAITLVSLAQGAGTASVREAVAALVQAEHPAHDVLWEIRVPRIAVAGLVGAALAVAGALLQTVLRNPLADPGLLGVTAGAGLGALCAILFLPHEPWWVPTLAFAGGVLGLACSLLAAHANAGPLNPLRLILAGVGLQAIGMAGVALLVFFFADRAPAFVAFTVGSLNGSGWPELVRVAVPTALGGLAALAAVRALDVLLLDDGSAGSVGLPVVRVRQALAGAAALLTAGAVSVVGLVGFVGLVVPNALRLVIGPAHGPLLGLAVLGGAGLVIGADAIARTAIAPLEIPVGALLALVGGPFLLYLLWRSPA